jgi:hypothetical protein
MMKTLTKCGKIEGQPKLKIWFPPFTKIIWWLLVLEEKLSYGILLSGADFTG